MVQYWTPTHHVYTRYLYTGYMLSLISRVPWYYRGMHAVCSGTAPVQKGTRKVGYHGYILWIPD